ncbi:MAG: hypothetical protein K8R02_07025 [Anaerohalosphaeraceae bacterium]|nr:hypothetical protein [Anaerohalosphaeraceae bacterium]
MRLKLNKGRYAIVDYDDWKALKKFNWRLRKSPTTLYAERTAYTVTNRQRNIALHRQIMNASKGIFIDHINHNGLDNRKTNLRPATPAQNAWNRKQSNANWKSSSKYRGVKWHRKSAKWSAQIGFNNKRKHLGYFVNEIEAAKAYDIAARKHHGNFATLNFPPQAGEGANPSVFDRNGI